MSRLDNLRKISKEDLMTKLSDYHLHQQELTVEEFKAIYAVAMHSRGITTDFAKMIGVPEDMQKTAFKWLNNQAIKNSIPKRTLKDLLDFNPEEDDEDDEEIEGENNIFKGD